MVVASSQESMRPAILMTLAFCAMAAMATDVMTLLLFFVLAGVSDIVLLSSVLASPGDFAQGRGLARATGIVIAAFGLPGIAVAPIAALLTDAYSWRAGFLRARRSRWRASWRSGWRFRPFRRK